MEISEILQNLTLKEKLKLLSGADFWHTSDLKKHGIPSMMMCDGPHGLRCQKKDADMLGVHDSLPATCFPTASITACSWDVELLGKIGVAIASEAQANEVGLVLGPGVNIKRDPLCGRNFEYFSEDPYLAGKLGAAFIRAAENKCVGTSLKHFALNNQEYKRFNGNSLADERTMREIYLAPFETAVKEGKPSTVMCAYNKINGVHCSDNRWLLTDVLRREWGFDGLVVTDWGAMNDRIAAIKAGCDLNMPGGSDYMEKDILRAVADGRLTEADIDICAERVLRLVTKPVYVEPADMDRHHTLARQAASESAVLLKNDGGILPLQKKDKILLLGSMADKPRYQGAGSSHINPIKLVSPKQVMPWAQYVPGCHDNGETDQQLLQEAMDAAKQADIAVIFAGLTDLYESEGFDRENITMPDGHIRLIEAVASVNSNTVVVLCCGSVVECHWADRVKGILYMGLAGQACGEAVCDLLLGNVNPSGKLAETWMNAYSDCPTADHYRGCKDPQYRESIYIGYRYYDKAQQNVRWPFGFGLSYTQFSYSDLCVSGRTVTCNIQNTGNVAGREVVQLYVAPPQNGLHRPVKELKGFFKVYLEPGEQKSVSFTLNDRSFAVWDGQWKIPGGEYGLLICSDSRTVRLSGMIDIAGETIQAPAWQAGSWFEHPCGTPTTEQWLSLYGALPKSGACEKGCFTMDHTVVEMRPHSLMMKIFYKCVELVISRPFGFKRDMQNPQYRMLLASSVDSPLRNIQICAGIKGGLIKGLLHLANGHVFKGICTILGICKF